MFKKLKHPMRFTAIISLVFVFALSVAWATINYYSASVVIHHGKLGKRSLVNGGNRDATIHIEKGALDSYMTDQGVNQVEITTELTEERISQGGPPQYKLEFTFGPSGAYFNPPLELELTKAYANSPDVWLYDENGELLEAKVNERGHEIRFSINHFSSYYYDDYDEYYLVFARIRHKSNILLTPSKSSRCKVLRAAKRAIVT
jgi:hypothetical protein